MEPDLLVVAVVTVLIRGSNRCGEFDILVRKRTHAVFNSLVWRYDRSDMTINVDSGVKLIQWEVECKYSQKSFMTYRVITKNKSYGRVRCGTHFPRIGRPPLLPTEFLSTVILDIGYWKSGIDPFIKQYIIISYRIVWYESMAFKYVCRQPVNKSNCVCLRRDLMHL